MPGFNSIVRAFASLGHDLGNSYVYDPNPNSFDCPPDSYHPPHPTYETYSYDSYGNDSQFGYDCPPQFPLKYDLPFHQLPQELSIQEMEDLKQQYLDELKRLSNLEYRDDIRIAELTKNFNDEFIKSSVENLIPIPSESEGIPEQMCDVPSHDNSPPLDVSNDQIEDFFESSEEFSSINDDSFSIDDIDYVEASPPDCELVSSEVIEIVIPKTQSSSTSLNSLLEETNTFDNSLPEFETFCFDVEEISSGSTTTHPNISLPEYEAFYDDHVKEISSGSPTTHSDSSLSASFFFDLSISPFPTKKWKFKA
nr:hypothetical protein [Tanacetum cinerariifolium]